MFTLSNKNCLATAIPIFDHLGDAVINTRSSNGIWLVFKLLKLQRSDGLPKTCRIMSITWKGETCRSQIQYVSSPTILYHKEYFKTICDSTKLTFMFLMEIITNGSWDLRHPLLLIQTNKLAEWCWKFYVHRNCVLILSSQLHSMVCSGVAFYQTCKI